MIQVYETGFSITCRRQYSLITNNSQKFGNRDFDRIEAIASKNLYSFIIKNQFFVLKFLRQLKKETKMSQLSPYLKSVRCSSRKKRL